MEIPPGTYEVVESSRDRIQEWADTLHERYLNVWLRKMFENGPAVANAYVAGMEKIRDDARHDLAEHYQRTNDINSMVLNKLKSSTEYLANVKLTATVGVAVVGAVGSIVLGPSGALISAGVSLGYSSTCSMFKTWEQGANAKVVGISVEAGKAGTSEVLGKLAGASQEHFFAKQTRSDQIINSAVGQIRKVSERLAEDGLRRAQRKIASKILIRSTVQVTTLAAANWKNKVIANLAGKARVGVPIAFAAWDIKEGFSDYNDTMKFLE